MIFDALLSKIIYLRDYRLNFDNDHEIITAEYQTKSASNPNLFKFNSKFVDFERKIEIQTYRLELGSGKRYLSDCLGYSVLNFDRIFFKIARSGTVFSK